jgi:hypothetical protein
MTAGQVPETIMTGLTADISHIAEFGWYDWVMYRDIIPSYPDDKLILGRYLGPATDIGLALTGKILQPNGQFGSVHLDKRQFDESVATNLRPASTAQDFPAKYLTPDPDHYDDTDPINPDHSDAEITPEMGDNYLSAEIMLPRGGTMVKGRVAARKRDRDDNPIGLVNSNPILDTRSYVVHFNDGDQTELTANMIVESLYSQCDPNGHEYILLDEIVGHRRTDSAIKLADQKVVRANDRTYLRCSTTGWQLCCQWKDGSSSWVNLADLKESHPIEVAEYAKIIGIDHEPAYNWWVPHILKKRDRIISLVRKQSP